MKLEYFIAFRYLTRRKKAGFISLISLISVLGVTVGVMALIVVLAVMSGFDRELKKKIVGIQPHLVIQQPGGISNSQNLADKIQSFKLPKVLSVAPFVNGQAIVRSGDNAMGAMINGIDLKNETLTHLEEFLREGDLDLKASAKTSNGEPSSGGIILGSILAKQLLVGVGDSVEIISPAIEKKGLFKRAKTETFVIRGIYHFGMHNIDASLVLMGLEEAKSLYNLGDRVTGLRMKLSDVYWAERVQELLHEKLDYNYWVQTWIDMNRNFFAALKVEKKVMTILLFLIILVAAFNIVSTLIMVVMEKTKDIAILKSLGATQTTVKGIFVLESMIVGLFGTALGVASGLAIATWLNPIADAIKKFTGFEIFPSDIYFFDRIPAQINVSDVVLVAIFAFITTVLAGFYPAKRAASLEPVEGLRYE